MKNILREEGLYLLLLTFLMPRSRVPDVKAEAADTQLLQAGA